jgi:hypothetical protein
MSLKDSIKQLQKREHITQDELLRRLGCSRSRIMDSTSSEAQTAFNLAFGKDESRDSKELEKLLSWVRKFPIRALQNMGFIPANAKGANLVRAVFRFMQIGSITGFNNYYSATLQSANPQTLAAWIRLGELRVKRLTTEYTPDREAILSNLKFLRANVYIHGQNLRNIVREALRNCGIEFIEVEPFLTAPTPTCAFYWRGYRPVIQFPTTKMDDSKFLEALFHAVAHVLYHPLRTSCLQLGNQAQIVQSNLATAAQEIEAKAFAQNMLLSEAEECELICCGRFNERRCIQHFSGQFHVRPGILVERLQQQSKIHRRSLLNEFKIAV